MSKKFTFKEVKKYFEDHGCELFETEYINCITKMRYRCICGNTKCKIRFNDFKKGIRCMECGTKKAARKQSFTFKEVKKYFKDHDCELFETEYVNNRTPMRYRCKCGNTKCKICFYIFKSGSRCMECAIKKRSGKNNGNYNPNLTDEERDKGRYSLEDKKWRKDVYEKNKYTCQICGDNKGGNLIAHHLESYDVNVELRLVVSNGITLCEKHHIEFHKKYGYGNNTRIQFEDFLITMNLVIN